MAAIEYDEETKKQGVQPATDPNAATAPRWSHHLAADPYGGATGAWAKQYYDNPNIDPNAAIQSELAKFRGQYGDAAPEDDASALAMIASGQKPQVSAGGQFPVQPYPSQLGMVNEQPRNDALYTQLLARAQQSTNVDRNDPAVRAQADAYAANEERSRRNYISDIAERSGPQANIRGEQRMASERVGQRTGAFEAQLVARELQTKRDEISQALEGLQGRITEDQRLALQRELGLLDAAIRQQLGQAGIGIQQGQLDLGKANLGLEAEQQASYWDWIRQGGTL